MDHLKRIKVSFFEEKDSLKLSEIEALAKEGKIDKFILKTEEVFNDLPSLYVLQESARIIDNGNPLLRTNVKSLVDESRPSDKERYKVYNSQGDFCAVYEYDESKDYFKPYKMFSV